MGLRQNIQVKYFEALGARIAREEYEKLKKFNNRHQLKPTK